MMVRSVIPDSDEDGGDETSPFDFSSTIRPGAAGAATQNVPAETDAGESGTPTISTQDDVIGQLLLGTGSTDSAVFQQIYNQHQLSTDATLTTAVSRPIMQHQPLSQHSTPAMDNAEQTQLTPLLPIPQSIGLSSSISSTKTSKTLKRSKTTINNSSFTSPEAPKNKMKRSKSVRSYPHTIEGSSQDITVDVEDTGKVTNLSQTSKEYRSMDTGKDKQRDVYDFPGSSEPQVITKKVPAQTTMENLRVSKTYGKVKRSRTMVAASSSPTASAQEKRRRGSDAGIAVDINAHKLSSSPPIVHEQAPERSLKENIQRKKEEKASATKQNEDIHTAEAETKNAVVKTKSPVKTYSKMRRSKTAMPSESKFAADYVTATRSADDINLDKHKKRKSEAHLDEEAAIELPKAKRYQRSKSTAAAKDHAAPVDVVDLSSSQVDPVDQVPDTIVIPTASMPKPLLKSSKDTVLVPATKSSGKSCADDHSNAKAPVHVDSNTSVVVDSNVSVVKATKSSASKDSSVGHAHPGTPKLPCFDSSQKQAEAVRSVLKKVDEIINSPAPGPGATHKSDTSSPLIVSFDKGLVGQSIVLVPEPTDSQKEQYKVVSVSSDEVHAAAASLPAMMSPAKVEKWSGASSTVANSTWKDRSTGHHSGDKRAPTMEPLYSQPGPSSRKANKRSKTGLESTTATRRGRSASVHSDGPPSSNGSDIVAKSSSRKIKRSKTMTAQNEPAKSSSQPRRTHVVKAITTYEKLKDPDESAPSVPEIAPSAEVDMEDTQAGSARGIKKTSDAADLDIAQEPRSDKSQNKTQEELDFELAKRLQEEMDKDDCEPETRARRRGPSTPKVVEPEPELELNLQDEGLPPPEMYKPRLSSRRSKSLSAKADGNAVETFIDALPRIGRKGKGKKAAKEKDAPTPPDKAEDVDKENLEPAEKLATGNVDTGGDTVMEDAGTITVASKAPESSFRKEKPAEEAATPAKLFPVPKKVSRAASKTDASVAADDKDDENGAPKKRGRASKAVINDTDDSAGDLNMDVDEQPVKPAAPTRGRGAAQKRAASIAAASKAAPKSKETVASEDDDDEGVPVKSAGRVTSGKVAPKAPAAKLSAKSKEIVDTDDDEDEGGPEPAKPASPVTAARPPPAHAAAPTPFPKPRGATRQKSTPGFKAPTMTRNKSTSAETDVPQTPRKDKETQKGSHELTPKSTPPGPVSHSPLRGGVVPLRVGLSKKTRLPSLLKIIRK